MSATRISAVACASGSARWHGRTDVPKKCASEARPTRATPAGEQLPGEADGVDDRRRQPAAGEQLDLAVEEREVEAGVVRDDDRALAREGEERADCGAGPRRPAQVAVGDAGDPGDDRRDGDAGSTRVWNVPAGRSASTRTAPISQIADRAGPESGRLEVDDDEARGLERQVVARRSGEPDAGAAPGEPRVARDDVVEQAPREPLRGVGEREERPGGLLDGHRPAPLLDELDEPVGGVEGELHALTG